MQLISCDDPRLLEKSVLYTINEIKTPETRGFVKELKQLMSEKRGIGISAVQVGVPKQVIVIETSEFSGVMFNPAILKRNGQSFMLEGCLSFPGKQVGVTRSKQVSVKYVDINGKVKYVDLSGMAARVFLHEYEHLQGIVLTSHEKNNS